MSIRKFAVATAVLLAVAVAGFAARASAACENIKLNKRPPIAFNPIPMKNPRTGEPYLPNEELEIRPGVRVRAQQFFQQLNELEYDLNQWGYSLREADVSTLSALHTCLELLTAQRSAIFEDVRRNGAAPWSTEERLAKIEAAWKAYQEQIPSWEELYKKADDESVRVYLPEPPPFTAPVPHVERADLKPVFKERAWSFEVGEKSKLYVSAQASLSVQASKVDAVSNARGAINAALLGKWEGEVLSAVANAQTLASDAGVLSFEVRGLGRVLWSKRTQAPGVRYTDELAWPLDYSVDYRFSIGPVPMRARVGFRATAGVGYGYDIVPLRIGAHSVPFVAADAYAQVGADIGIAAAGVGGQLVLIQDSVTLQGHARVEFEEEPSLIVELNGHNRLTALSGNLYAFAYVDYLAGRWEGRWDLWNWEGLEREGSLFQFKLVWTPSGVTAQGDVRAEDLMQVDQANAELRLAQIEGQMKTHLWQVMAATSVELNDLEAARVLTEHNRLTSIAGGLDNVLGQYEAELKRWAR